MLPLDYYYQQCQNGSAVYDAQQEEALTHLQTIYYALLHEHQKRNGFLHFLRKPKLIPGLYLWGGVGIGKTFLMDCFYHTLPFIEKMRMHFHAFMAHIHQALKEHAGKKEPLQKIAKKIAKKTMVLCLDEFLVTDITDAMLLRHLLTALFNEGVTLVTTSNTIPDELYKNGLQRKLFLPAIELLKQHTTVFHVPITVDYRLRHLKQAGVFYLSTNPTSHEQMENTFAILANHDDTHKDPIHIYGRTIHIKKQSGHVIWFDFHQICAVPRSQHDYLNLVKRYRTIFISDIPIIPANAKDTILLFIRLIDVLYDSRTCLVFSAATTIDNIYPHGQMLTEFARTKSRLLEMQSEDYVAHIFEKSP